MGPSSGALMIRCARCREVVPPGKITCIHCGTVYFGTPKSANPNDFGIVPLSKVEQKPLERYVTGLCDKMWGTDETPGIVTTSVTLFAGDPGVGKSTFFLQLFHALWKLTGRPGIYVALEEDAPQVLDRALRLGVNVDSILVLTNAKRHEGKEITRAALKYYNPSCVAVDSVQKMGGLAEALFYCEHYKGFAQTEKIPFFIICQINSSDDFAGGKKIQHEPDTLLYMSKAGEIQGMDKRVHYPPDLRMEVGGANIEPFRILSCRKNRFGTEKEQYLIMRKAGLEPYNLPEPGEEEDEDEDERPRYSAR
jgi:predicted ATP-dependent serine protease